MAKTKKHQNYGGMPQSFSNAGRSTTKFLSTPTGKGLLAAGAVALAGLFFSKDRRAQGARDSLRGAADRMRERMGDTFRSSSGTTGSTGSTTASRSATNDGATAH